MKSTLFILLMLLFWTTILLSPSAAWAGNEMNVAGNAGKILRGTVKTVGAAFQIPVAMMQDSSRVMFPFGLLTGAIRGGVKTVTGTLSGALDIAQGAAPYAKYAVFA